MNYFLLIFAYFVGAIPFGLLIGKIVGLDVRKAGSGNIGATNVNRLLGKKLGLITLAADIGKAVLPMMLAHWLLAGDDSRDIWVVLCGGAAFIGHLFPVYLKFKGGKGVAAALGIFLYLTPIAALIVILIFAMVLYNWGFVSLASLTGVLLLPGLIWLIYGMIDYTMLAVFIGGLIWFKHRDNIIRLLSQKEKSWREP